MYNLVEDVLKVRIQKEINENLEKLGLLVNSISLLEHNKFDIVIEIVDKDKDVIKSSCEIAS